MISVGLRVNYDNGEFDDSEFLVSSNQRLNSLVAHE